MPAVPGAAAPVDWGAARTALAHEVARVTGLLRTVRRPQATALGHWSLVEVAVHLSQAFVAVPGLFRRDLGELFDVLPGRAPQPDGALLADVWELAGTTALGVRTEAERDPAVLADRIDARAARFLGDTAGADPDAAGPWLVAGVPASVRLLACHLLNETVVHGYDMATADGRRWPVSGDRARLVLDGFVFPVVTALGSAMVSPAAADLRACFAVHLRGGGRHVMAFDAGALAVDPDPAPRVDCHLSADPAAFLLVVWGRRNQWRSVARGELAVWGRAPWLGPRLRALIRNP